MNPNPLKNSLNCDNLLTISRQSLGNLSKSLKILISLQNKSPKISQNLPKLSRMKAFCAQNVRRDTDVVPLGY
eukprot:233892-Amorphochlora_amoeboformis.AAC.1